MKEAYNITGMTCSACSARVERGLAKLEGVTEVSVNLLKNSMSITYDDTKLNSNDIIKKIEDIGYNASLHKNKTTDNTISNNINNTQNDDDLEVKSMRNILIISAIFTIPLFYIAMGEMLNLPMPHFFSGMENAMIFAFTQFLLTIPVMVANRKYFKLGIKNIIKLSPNMDSLIALGAGAAFIYGIYSIYKIAIGMGHGNAALGHGNAALVHEFAMSLYFESSAMILTLITLGKFFELRAKKKTSDAIVKLMNLTPKTAIIYKNETEHEISVNDVISGDILVVKAGNSVPVDGIIIDGYSSIDESAITGESLPVEKSIGDKVTGGTINKTGYFMMRATAVGENTTIAKIIALVDEATSSKAPIAKLADKISGIFVPIVICIAILSFIIWLLIGQSLEFALSIGISVLVISCPCALGLATPTAIMVGTGRAASKGILIKSATALEIAHSIDVVVLDKTGTITKGKPAVTDVIAINGDETNLLYIASSLENKSGHPLSEPIISKAKELNISIATVSNYELIAGEGIVGRLDNIPCYAGNRKLMNRLNIDISAYLNTEDALANEGKTPLYFAYDNKLLGIIAVSDLIKPTSASAVARLYEMGIDVVMLTGDNAKTAAAIQKQVGIKKVIAEVLPEDKEREIKSLQERGHKVAMVGDGINDSPALTRADVGIAIGAGTEIAIESADIVLIKGDLNDVPAAISLSKAVMKNIRQNLFWAFFYNSIGIPIAAGVLYYSFSILLNPMLAAAAMSFSSVSVVTNALRLRFFTPKWR